ncbi:putative ABC exporter domain-containing protein [Faecalispora anaeroviscerum]|uniref:putative ABC exporter domain-containing protein n=1 Tax=Faecalispora anaeroviscerum TaxID=2991836 RepID=UPI0024BBDBFF|nr:putative ABC exporter domain-containing protein [Faecalispora anaeroviscerum]
MRSICYLSYCQAKNSLLDMLRHPAKLIAYLFVIAMIVFSVFTKQSSTDMVSVPDTRLIQGVYFFILLGLLMMILQSGLKSGSTFFSMPDVNLLFVSPLRPNLILAYGLVKQMTSMILVVVFLMLYSPMLMEMFDLTPWQIFMMIVGLAFLLILAQILSMLLYNISNGSPARRRVISSAVYGAAALPTLFVAANALRSENVYQGALQAGSSPLLDAFPVAGWIRGAIFGAVSGPGGQMWLYTALILVITVVSLILLVKGNPDYYEDVLQSTEVTYEAMQEKKANENGAGLARFRNRHAVKKGGFRGGWGASTFFYKQLCEMRRKNRFGFLTTSTIMVVLIAVGMAIFLERISRGDSDPMDAEAMYASVLSTEIYLLFFFQAAADWVSELKKPYIYLVPASSLSRLIWASATTLAKPLVDGALAFTVLWLYLRVSPIIWICSILMYASFGFLFTSTSILFFRLFGQPAPRGLLAFLQLLILLALAIPGGLLALIALVALHLPWYLAGIAFSVGCILVTLGIYSACHNILEAPEMR